MDKEKEIEEKIESTVFYAQKEAEKQADEFGYTGDKREFHILSTIAKVLVATGYRKADEVCKETIKKCSEWLRENATIIDEENFAREFDFAFGIEVDE